MKWNKRTDDNMPNQHEPLLFRVQDKHGEGIIEKGSYVGGSLWKTDTHKSYPTAYVTDWILIEEPERE